jgi:hypothetical protein
MRYLVAILLFLSTGAFAQKPDTMKLAWSVHAFNTALVKKDTVQLNRFLRDDVRYYHSNGWLQLKKDMIDDLYNGKLTYNQINASSPMIHFDGNIAQVGTMADVDVTMNGKQIQLKLKVVQVWIWKNKKWEMYSRHSEKV